MAKPPTTEQQLQGRSAAIDAKIATLQLEVAPAAAVKAATIVKLNTEQEHPDVAPSGPCPYPAGDPRVVELPTEIAEKQVGSLPVGGILRVMIGDDAYIRTLKKREAMMLPDATRGRKNVTAGSAGGKAKAKKHSFTPDQRKAAAKAVADLMEEGYRITPASETVAGRKLFKINGKPVSARTLARAYNYDAKK